MEPTIKQGIRFGTVGYASQTLPQLGDVVVFQALMDGKEVDFIKRVVGLPGDRVRMINGAVYLNDVAVKRERIDDYEWTEKDRPLKVKQWRETLPNGVSYETIDIIENGFYDHTQEYIVPPGHYFMMGDNRDTSLDSRAVTKIGYVPLEKIVGKVMRSWREIFSALYDPKREARQEFHQDMKGFERWST